ncbi:MAG: hypothetical protein Unbinned96contig1001_35 [Prokaryotic dsDNA virus sp.]|nr:MAG: hypothetical protein Unbinned96contig1001_35 [Prokaryotic dsDNA virus sp.]|tara:strand:+ start:1498 stop:1914 length:417 start_codon:yes stop_codon:yes gene_type:complete
MFDPVTALTVAVVGTSGASIVSAEKGRKEQRKARRVQERVRQVQSARDRMSQVRQQRIAQAQIVQGAATQGTAQSSAAQGGYSAVGSLSSGNMQFLNQMDSLSQTIQGHMNKASQYSGQASMLNAVSNLALQASGGVK